MADKIPAPTMIPGKKADMDRPPAHAKTHPVRSGADNARREKSEPRDEKRREGE